MGVAARAPLRHYRGQHSGQDISRSGPGLGPFGARGLIGQIRARAVVLHHAVRYWAVPHVVVPLHVTAHSQG